MNRRELLWVVLIIIVAATVSVLLSTGIKRHDERETADRAAAQVSRVFRTGNCTVYRIVVEDHAYLVNDQGGVCPMPAAAPEKH